MATSIVTLSGGITFDGKNLIVPNGTTKLDLSTFKDGDGAVYAKGSTTETVAAGSSFAKKKIAAIDATAVTNAILITGTLDKAASVSLGSGGGTIESNSTGADKLFGTSSGKDTFILTGTKAGGSDVIGSSSSNGYDKGDKVILSGANTASLTFADNLSKQNLVVTTGDKAKYTIFRPNNTPVSIQGSNGTIVYGVDGENTELDSSGKTLTIKKGSSGATYAASTLAAGAKNIGVSSDVAVKLNIVGNGQANNITIGSAGGTLNGGVNGAKATNDNLYGASTGSAVVFQVDALGGNDNVYGYKNGDTLYINDGSNATIDFSSSNKNFKDGGIGKDIVIPYGDGNKSKLTVKSTNETYLTINRGGTVMHYGVDLAGTGLSVDSKKSSLVIGASAAASTYAIEGWDNGTSKDALRQFAPKLNTIDASTATKKITLQGMASVSSILKGGTSATTMQGGTAADQYYGGTGSDTFLFDVGSGKEDSIGKDVIDSYGAKDVIMLKGLNTSVKSALALSSSGVLTFSTNTAKTKLNTVTVKNFKSTTTAAPVVVVDDEGNILAVGSNAGAPTPNGLENTKTGLVTSSTFDGKYATDAYVVGSTIKSDGSAGNPNTALGLTGTGATISAATYGGAVKAINATVVGSTLKEMLIEGNANVKNTIYTPARNSGSVRLGGVT